jgi:TRAP-type C4-dicarboxylate transport system permease small subunit
MTNIYSTRSPIKPVPTENEEIISCYKYFNCFYRVEKMFSYSLGIIMSLFTNALGLLVVAQVILRYVFKSPKVGIEELTPLLALWAYFLGVVYSVRIRDHIGGGILSLVCKNVTVLKTIRLIGSILCFVSISVFAYYAYRNMAMNFGIGRLSIYMRWPKWFWDFSVVFGFTLSSLYFIFQTILEAIDLFYVTKNKGVTFIEEIQEGENDNV